jgi:hypothetical protein
VDIAQTAGTLQGLPTLPHFTLSVAGLAEQYDDAGDRDVAGPMRETFGPEDSCDPPTELSRFP